VRLPLSSSRLTTGTKFAPLLGALIGAVGGAVYWVAVQIWPTSVAVILSMAATALLSGGARGSLPMRHGSFLVQVFFLLTKYSALMALSAAKLPFVAPANLALGWVMVSGYAASYALRGAGLSMLIGFAPAALLGIPGLTGLVCAILVSLGFAAYRRRVRAQDSGGHHEVEQQDLHLGQQLTEVSFYLGALATWSYV
jgi:hypothetical protein